MFPRHQIGGLEHLLDQAEWTDPRTCLSDSNRPKISNLYHHSDMQQPLGGD